MRPHNVWLGLGILVAIVAWLMTRWITHVNHEQPPIIDVVFEESRPFQLDKQPLNLPALQTARHRFAEVALTGPGKLIFLVTPTTKSIAIRGLDPSKVACGSFDQDRWSTALVSGADEGTLTPIPVAAGDGGTLIPVPPSMQAEIATSDHARGAIACKLGHPLATSPTFTEREATVHVDTGAGGAVLVDVSGLEDIDNLRFSGGLQMPLGGDRSRLLYGGNDVVSAEWVDVAASEQRDIFLVLIGALSAVAAAMIIEGIRPVVERRSAKLEGKGRTLE